MIRIVSKKLKMFKTFLLIFLILGVFANAVLAEACFCGKTCSHSLQDKSKTNTRSPFHHRCSGVHCKSCDLEKGQALKAANSKNLTPNVKILGTAFTLSTLFDHTSTHHILQDFDTSYVSGSALYSPIYLQNLSILC
jgi:hypothetical protein